MRLADPKVALLSFLLNDDGTFQGSAVNNNGTRMGFKYKPKPADVKFVGKTFSQTDTSRGWTNFELVYGGTTGESISVLYREYTPDDLARPAYTQTLSYATGSSVIRFRNVKIEVASADNEKIEYTVVADGYPAP